MTGAVEKDVRKIVDRWDQDRDIGRLFVEQLTEDLTGYIIGVLDRVDREARAAASAWTVIPYVAYPDLAKIIDKIQGEAGA